MKIAICSNRADSTGLVPDFFHRSDWLLIVEVDSGLILAAIARNEGGDMALAREILNRGCEGLLCGPINREPFLIIADEGQVTRYNAAGLHVEEALEKFKKRSLDLIRDHIGSAGPPSHSGSGGCEGRH